MTTLRERAKVITTVDFQVNKPSFGFVHVAHLNRVALMEYHDDDGVVTERRVIVHTATGVRAADGTVVIDHLAGYCQLRRMPRSFRTDRILRIEDAETGFPVACYCNWLQIPAVVDVCGRPLSQPLATR